MAQAVPVNPITTNSPFTGAFPITGQSVDLSKKIDSNVVPENERQAWKIQVIDDPRLAAKVQFQKDLQAKLEEIRQEAVKARALDNDIDPVLPEAYNDAFSLLEMFFDHNISIPHIGWSEDGSIGFEWRPKNGIVTMGIYGDDLVIYGVFFEKNRQVDGVCSLSDTALLEGFLETLKRLL